MNPSDREFELDQQLRNVPVPRDLAARLKSIPDATEIEAAIDAELNAVAVPQDFTRKLHQIAATSEPVSLSEPQPTDASRHRPARWVSTIWSVAAVLLVAIGVSWFVYTLSNNNLAKQDLDTPFPTNTNTAITPDSEPQLAWLDSFGPESNEQRLLDAPLPSSDELALLGSQLELPDAPDNSPASNLRIRSLSDQLPSDPLASTFLMRFQPLGANPLISAETGRPQMILPTTSPVSFVPSAKAYDRDFLMRESVQPFASPLEASLRSVRLPISAAEESYENVVFTEKPWSAELLADARMEQWLAATGKFYVPAQPGQVELRTAAGPAVFARDRTQLLQIGVVAGSADPVDRPPAHITVAVTPPSDAANAMRTWLPVKIALREMIEHLQPHDTITLVVMSEFPHVMLEDAAVSDSELWFTALDRIDAGTQSNLAEGIRLAAATAISKPGFGDIRRPLIVLSDRFAALDEATNRQLRPLVEDATSQHVDFSWVQLEDRQFASISPAPSSLEGLGTWTVTNSLKDLCHLLDHEIHNAPTLVGTNPRINIKWNEKSVSQYRLIGYQPVGGDFMPTSQTQELHAFDSGTVLFEVILPEEGPNEVAQIELEWRDADGKARKSMQKVSRLQLASSWPASPLSLQAAQLTAECLSLQQNSYFSRRRGNTVDELEKWASAINPALMRHASYPRLELLLPPSQP